LKKVQAQVLKEVAARPELLLASKQSVDEDAQPGRFPLTDSANLLTIKTVNEFRVGRVEVVPLYPLGAKRPATYESAPVHFQNFPGACGACFAARDPSACGTPIGIRSNDTSQRLGCIALRDTHQP
jgi:hypothetical protein